MNLIYISGYAGSGKSTFASNFRKDGYKILHIDEFIRNEMSVKFGKYNVHLFDLYSVQLSDKLIELEIDKYFINYLKSFINKHKKVVLEGQIKNQYLLKSIFREQNIDVYIMKPKNQTIYKKRITSRFINDPANYGRIGFLEAEDIKTGKQGLNDYIKNGINGKIIKKIINTVARDKFYKHDEYFNYFKKIFPNAKQIIN